MLILVFWPLPLLWIRCRRPRSPPASFVMDFSCCYRLTQSNYRALIFRVLFSQVVPSAVIAFQHSLVIVCLHAQTIPVSHSCTSLLCYLPLSFLTLHDAYRPWVIAYILKNRHWVEDIIYLKIKAKWNILLYIVFQKTIFAFEDGKQQLWWYNIVCK